MRISIHHTTLYQYDEPLVRSTQLIRLTPRQHPRQTTQQWRLQLPAAAESFTDAYGNISHLLSMQSQANRDGEEGLKSITITAHGNVAATDEELSAGQSDDCRVAAGAFVRSTPLTEADEAIWAFVAPMQKLIASRPLSGLTDLMFAVLDHMPYQPGTTEVTSTASESFAQRSGVCQDHAHVFIACCRALGIPARYVSGYVYSPHHDEVASHAWAQAWLSQRWSSFDISNAREAGDYHVELAIGMDYMDACPVRGIRVGGGREHMTTRAQVRLADDQGA